MGARLLVLVLAILLGAGCGGQDTGCTKDPDCKGDRICEDGRCTAPESPAVVKEVEVVKPAPKKTVEERVVKETFIKEVEVEKSVIVTKPGGAPEAAKKKRRTTISKDPLEGLEL